MIKNKKLWLVLATCFLALMLLPCLAMAVEPDAYEDDDEFSKAKLIIVGGESQHHNFHDQGDADWVIFYAVIGNIYEIKAHNVGDGCNVVLNLYDDRETKLKGPINDGLEGEDEEFSNKFSKDGSYLTPAYVLRHELFQKMSGFVPHPSLRASCFNKEFENDRA